MDNRLDGIVENLENMQIGPDDEFKFHCTMCGKCCRDRDDILLSPDDLFRLAVGLDIKPYDVCEKYCHIYIGNNSRLPLIRLRSIGIDERCPFLCGNRCSVNTFKPHVCGLFPLGRLHRFDRGGDSECKYILQPVKCGDKRRTHTVRKWLSDAGIPLNDPAFFAWNRCVGEMFKRISVLEKILDAELMEKLEKHIFATIYLDYDLDKKFLPQFNAAVDTVLANLDKIISAFPGNINGRDEQ